MFVCLLDVLCGWVFVGVGVGAPVGEGVLDGSRVGSRGPEHAREHSLHARFDWVHANMPVQHTTAVMAAATTTRFAGRCLSVNVWHPQCLFQQGKCIVPVPAKNGFRTMQSRTEQERQLAHVRLLAGAIKKVLVVGRAIQFN